MTGHYPGFERFWRVSTVCDALARTESDGLTYAGGTWAAQEASRVCTAILDGNYPHCVQRWLDRQFDANPIDYLKSKEFIDHCKSHAKREQQAAADRGTLTGYVWDMLTDDPTLSVDDSMSFIEERIAQEAETARISMIEYQSAVQMGLIDEKDELLKPKRGYQCSLGEVFPFVLSLITWYPNCPFISRSKQGFLSDDHLMVCGTYDDHGDWDDMRDMVVDVKTSTSSQPKRYHRAQLAAYKSMMNAKHAANVIITPDGVYCRFLDECGERAGYNDFLLALQILKQPSMKNSYKPASFMKPKTKTN